MAEIVEGLPLPLSKVGQGSASYQNRDFFYDVAIGGVPFLISSSDSTPMQRATAQVRKDQVDTSVEPGEQSLSTYWLRSQSSFHYGAGLRFVEPASDDIIMTQFRDSAGVDVWTPGEVTLLRQTDHVQDGAADSIALGYNDGSNKFLFANGAEVRRHNGTVGTVATWGGSGTVLSMTHDGANAFIADETGIYEMALASGAGVLAWNTGSPDVVLGWSKQRLIAGIGNSIYELVGSGPALPTPLYTHPNTAWVWTSITEGPGAIYASGYSGNRSAIYRFSLEDDGSVPALENAVVAAELPLGERVFATYGYLGAFIGIGTNKGIRIGVMAESGEIQYGPLTVETEHAVKCFAGKDRFLFAGVEDFIDGGSGLVRIDLGAEVEPLRYAYATDLQTGGTGPVDSVSVFGISDRLVMASTNAYLETSDTLMASGYLRTGRVRFNTLEPKLFKALKVQLTADAGQIVVSTVTTTDAETSVVTLDDTINLTEDININNPTGPQETLSLKFTLNRDDSEAGEGPTLRGYQLKALPATDAGEMLRVPLMLFDREKDRNNLIRGRDGWAWERFQVLKEIERTRDIRRFQDLRVGSTDQVLIESVEFEGKTPPWGKSTGFGGICYLTMRTVP